MRLRSSRAPQLRNALSKTAVRVIDLFREWDDDNSGKVSRSEFHKAMPMLGFFVGREEMDALFNEWDLDKSGYIEIEELNKLLRRGNEIELDGALQAGGAGEIELDVDQNFGLRTGKINKNDSRLLQTLDLDESPGAKPVAEQAQRHCWAARACHESTGQTRARPGARGGQLRGRWVVTAPASYWPSLLQASPPANPTGGWAGVQPACSRRASAPLVQP